MKTLICIGECMVELAETGPGRYARGFAGDTFNAAWYARRALPDDWQVGYASCIGEDAISEEMTAFIEGEGISTRMLRRVPGRTVGLYMISLAEGERSFAYWRGQSAARLLADDADWLEGVLSQADHVHVSGITLAILAPDARARFLDALGAARRQGLGVSFDTNVRPRLWESEAATRAAMTAAAGVSDIVLPSFDEEEALFGDADPAATIARYAGAGARTVVVKNGPSPMLGWDGGDPVEIPVAPVEAVVDTTAAGDSFAGAFLAARLTGADLGQAMAQAATVAGRVIGAPGALVR
ncbi:sugar kinase [Salipiger sp. IMCC34102]|uniref:sugar kinase n=1 Tax=Salipiger sp. IMCC34102 TaxID=2510647 RepID=UPI00101D2DDE|nr:sugar kinase [Salipiger sp. IMCC34102]RYH03512.1 sugar kinase [Salipiger sp. IMCC34102]